MRPIFTIAMALLLSLPGQAEGLVLCFSHTGGVAVEMGCEGTACCTEAHGVLAGATEEEVLAAFTQYDTCSCTDIPLLAGPKVVALGARAPEAPRVTLTMAAVDGNPLHLLCAARAFARYRACPDMPPLLPTPVSLSTCMLL